MPQHTALGLLPIDHVALAIRLVGRIKWIRHGVIQTGRIENNIVSNRHIVLNRERYILIYKNQWAHMLTDR